MMSTTATGRQLTFRVPGRGRRSGVIKNPDAELGKVATNLAARLGMAGTFECLDRNQQTISPETRLADLPDDDITLASNLTPAARAAA